MSKLVKKVSKKIGQVAAKAANATDKVAKKGRKIGKKIKKNVVVPIKKGFQSKRRIGARIASSLKKFAKNTEDVK